MNIDQFRPRIASISYVEFHGPVSSNELDAAEAALGTRFPRQYRRFLELFGCGAIGSEEVIGLGGPDFLNVVLVRNDLLARRPTFPTSLLPIRNDGGGNYDCIDTSQRTSEDEFKIVKWRHDQSVGETCGVLAASFSEWLDELVELVKRLEAGLGE